MPSSSIVIRFEWQACARGRLLARRADAEEGECAGPLLQHVREVLGAHDRRRHPPDALAPSRSVATSSAKSAKPSSLTVTG